MNREDAVVYAASAVLFVLSMVGFFCLFRLALT